MIFPLLTGLQNKEPRGFVVYFLLTMPRVFINNCSIEELMSVPGIGAKVADKILDLREAKGDLELDDLTTKTRGLLFCGVCVYVQFFIGPDFYTGRFCLLLFKLDNVKQTNKQKFIRLEIFKFFPVIKKKRKKSTPFSLTCKPQHMFQ
jgi:hypothetical protein